MTTPSVLALIPAYNEAQRIAAVIMAARQWAPVLVVDDGSADETANIAEATGAAVLRQVPNQGKGAALRAGMRWALQRGYTAAATLDADGQHDPSELPRFLECHAATSADLIIGRRDFSRMPMVRRVANTVGRWSFSWAVGQPIPDNQSGYRLLSRRMMEAILDSQEKGFEFEVEMITTCVRLGYRLEWVPISTIYGDQDSHIRPWQHATNFVRLVRRTRAVMRQPQALS